MHTYRLVNQGGLWLLASGSLVLRRESGIIFLENLARCLVKT